MSTSAFDYAGAGGDLSRRALLARAGGLAAAAVVPDLRSTLPRRERPAAAQDAFPRKTDFDIPDGITYLNGAYMHPMPRVVRAAVRGYNDRRAGFTTRTSDRPDIGGEVKAAFARLVNASPEEIAFVPNTSTGEVLVVHGLGIPRAGGNVVTDALHFEGSIVHLQPTCTRTSSRPWARSRSTSRRRASTSRHVPGSSG